MGTSIGRLYVRRSSFIHAAAERVWEEFTSFERLSAWFSQVHVLEAYEPYLGGRVRLSVDFEGATRYFGGRVVVFDPGGELTFSENWEVDGWPVPAFVTFRLTPLYDCCHVELFHHGFERLGEAAGSELEGHEEGWHSRHLEALKKIVQRTAS